MNIDFQLTQEQIVDKGRRASSILLNTELMGTVEEIKADLTQMLLSTSVEQSEERELIYHQILGLTNLIAYLQSYQAAASQIENQTTIEE